MKRTYIAPKIIVVNLENEGLIANSGLYRSVAVPTTGEAPQVTYEETYRTNIWDNAK